MHEEFQATLEKLLGEYNRQVKQVREVHARLHEVSATVTAPDGTVTVRVGLQGRVDALEFHPRVYSRLSPSDLSGTILDLIDQATSAVTAQTRELMAPLVHEDMSVDEFFGTAADMTFLPPKPQPTARRTRQ
ncbi:YbaB/EbfC family nucleoid-associated protein [Streptosporangium sp. CA-135522]|uniref:YbaB/EbfC family nucleoid-associated protein n=1 Tax=Streptosporangium sp. CA-135522 TaxID=3240072 RepID=UPI003D90FEBD